MSSSRRWIPGTVFHNQPLEIQQLVRLRHEPFHPHLARPLQRRVRHVGADRQHRHPGPHHPPRPPTTTALLVFIAAVRAVPLSACPVQGQDLLGGFVPVHGRHPQIHQHDVDRPFAARPTINGHLPDGLPAIVGFVDVRVAEFGEHADEELAVDFVVFGHEEGQRVFLRQVAVEGVDLFRGCPPAWGTVRLLGKALAAR